jgi:Autographiviridae endonuclease
MLDEEYLKAKLLSRRSIEDRGYTTPCWIWLGAKTDTGYGHLRKYPTVWRVHILAAKLWIPNFTPKLKTLHKCDIRLCFNPEHLFQGTQKENVEDAIRKGHHKIFGYNIKSR